MVFLETRQPHFATRKILTVTNHVFSTANLFFANHLDLLYRSAAGHSPTDSATQVPRRLDVAASGNSPLRRRRFPATVNTSGRCRVNRHPGARLFADLLARHIDDDETKRTGAVCRRSFQREGSACEGQPACTPGACTRNVNFFVAPTYLFVFPSIRPSVPPVRAGLLRRALRSYANARGVS